MHAPRFRVLGRDCRCPDSKPPHKQSPLYTVIYKEILSSALPGRAKKQAPRMLISMIAALEKVVVGSGAPPYFRIFAWWLLLQNWGTLRFSDHRGIIPSEASLQSDGFLAKLTRSKTLGADRDLQSRPVVVDAACFVVEESWMKHGWELLQTLADFPRDYLMPCPSSSFLGCIKKELRYDTAFAVQHRVLSTLSTGEKQMFQNVMPQFWTPHSGRTFLPSAAAALGIDKAERDYLGGWSAQGSDRYARVAKRRIRNMQKLVVKSSPTPVK